MLITSHQKFSQISISAMPLLVILISCGISFSQDLFMFELENREQAQDTVEDDKSSWMFGDGKDTLEYSAVDLQYNVSSQTFNLNDKAILKYRTATLSGDTVIYNQGARTIEVYGTPVFRETSQPTLASYKMKYNLNSKTGEIIYGTSYMDNQQFNGNVIRTVSNTNKDSLSEQRFLIERGDFSTCDNPNHQHYNFYVRRMVLKPKEGITARPVVLNIGEVPVAILPLLVNPLKSGKSSGLLTPKFGGDQAQGFFMNNLGFYYAPNDYWDAMLYANLMEGQSADFSKSNANAEIRYNKLYTLDGFVNATGYLSNGTIWEDYDIRFRHNQNIAPDRSKTLSGEGSFVSRKDLRRENGIDEQTILNQQANANMTYYQKIGDNKNISIRTGQEYNLLTGLLRRQLPDIRFNISTGPLFEADMSGKSINPPFWEKINYSYSNNFNHYMVRAPDTIWRDSINYRTVDTTAYYTGFSDRLVFDYNGTLFDVFSIRPSLNLYGNWTAKEYIDTTFTEGRYAFNPSKSEFGKYFFKGDVSLETSTKLYGIWLPEWGRFVGARHILSPMVSVTYKPEMGDSINTFFSHPLLGQSAHQKEERTVGFRLGNDFDIKYLLQSADSTDKDSDSDNLSKNLRILTTTHTTSYNFAAKDSIYWSPITSTFGIQVLENYIFTINTTHNVYHKHEDEPKKLRFPQLTSWSYGLERSFYFNGEFNSGLPSKKGKYETRPWNAGVDYRYTYSSTRVGKNMFKEDITHYASFSASISPTRKWKTQYNSQYSFEEGKFVSHSLQFFRDLHCWKMDFTWRPAGAAPGWSFAIYVVDLPDIRLSASNTKEYSEYGY